MITPRFVRGGYRPHHPRLASSLVPEPVAGPPHTDAQGRVHVTARPSFAIVLLGIGVACVFFACVPIALENARLFSVGPPPPNANYHGPVPTTDWTAYVFVLVFALGGVLAAVWAISTARTCTRIEVDPAANTIRIRREGLFVKSESASVLNLCQLELGPHEESLPKGGTLRTFTLLLTPPSGRPVVLVRTFGQRPKQARAAIDAARTWMAALRLDCRVDPHAPLHEALTPITRRHQTKP